MSVKLDFNIQSSIAELIQNCAEYRTKIIWDFIESYKIIVYKQTKLTTNIVYYVL